MHSIPSRGRGFAPAGLAAAAFGFMAFFAPAGAAEVKEYLDLPYYEGADADQERHKLNLLVPVSDTAVPVLVWIPGGAWATGSRLKETEVARRLARAGVATAAIDHRMSPNPFTEEPQPPGATHPDHVIDSARATAWVIKHAKEYNLDPKNVFVGGYSAGAHLAALLVMDDQYLKQQGLKKSDIRAAIPVAGGYDMARYYIDQIEEAGQAFGDRHVMGVFGTKEALTPASPNAYLNDATVPMFVLAEGQLGKYTEWFDEEVTAAGKTDLIQFKYYPDLTHSTLFRQLRDEDESVARDDIVNYVMKLKR